MNTELSHRVHSIFQISGQLLAPILVGIIGIGLPEASAIIIYQCSDLSGTRIFTDSPAQLEHCTPFVNDDQLSPLAPLSSPTHRPIQKHHHSTVPPQPHKHESSSVESGRMMPSDQSHTQDDTSENSDSASPSMTVRLTKIGGALITQVRLNHTVDTYLIVDTGATMTVLSYAIAIELGLLSGSNNSMTTVNTAGGSIQVSTAHLDHVQVGQAEVRNVAVAIHDLPESIAGVSGLLGLSFLNNFLVTLDAKQSLLHLQSRQEGH